MPFSAALPAVGASMLLICGPTHPAMSNGVSAARSETLTFWPSPVSRRRRNAASTPCAVSIAVEKEAQGTAA